MSNSTRASADLDAEEWRAIPGWEGLYEASDKGRVRSLDRIDNQGHHLKGRILKQTPNKRGYPCVNLRDNGRRRMAPVHQVVVEAFIGPRPDGAEVCHWNDVKTDNRLENLRYDTSSANKRDCVRNGRHQEAALTHCPKCGGKYVHGTRGRHCPVCAKAWHKAHREELTARQRIYYAEHREEINARRRAARAKARAASQPL